MHILTPERLAISTCARVVLHLHAYGLLYGSHSCGGTYQPAQPVRITRTLCLSVYARKRTCCDLDPSSPLTSFHRKLTRKPMHGSGGHRGDNLGALPYAEYWMLGRRDTGLFFPFSERRSVPSETRHNESAIVWSYYGHGNLQTARAPIYHKTRMSQLHR